MSGGLQISTFIIPSELWNEGPSVTTIPLAAKVPLFKLSIDGKAIERRANSGLNLAQEERRYRLCYSRIQGIVCDLWDAGISQPRFVFCNDLAAGLLNVLDSCFLWVKKMKLQEEIPEEQQFLCGRIAAGFFPPEDAIVHFEFLSWVSTHSLFQRLLNRAVKQPSLGGIILTVQLCEQALKKRRYLTEMAMNENAGLVDVIQ